MNNKVKEVLDNILERFKSGDIPKAIAWSTFPAPNIPSKKWSFTNRLIMLLADTTDARGIRQWNNVGRKVKKGAKAIYIIVPRIVAVTDTENKDEETEKYIIEGFLAQPVFRAEDTEGEPLDYEQELYLPDLPLMEIARDWGISVLAIPAYSPAFGSYIPATQEIHLATPEEIVFFHELSHAAHARVIKELKPGQHWDQEVVAELCAQVLCHLVGKQPDANLGNSYRYIESYAREAGLSPLAACLKVIDDVQKVLSHILNWPDHKNQTTLPIEKRSAVA